MNILIVIPARGGSKGIPRKNLRALKGRPLIQYAIENALRSRYSPDVYVSSDDDEILFLATRCGAKPHLRDSVLAKDATTLDPVIFDAYQAISRSTGKAYDLIVTMQPTSPLLKTESLDAAIDMLLGDSQLDTVISAVDDTHLTWRRDGERFVPNYKQRVNRQQLPPTFKETGGFLVTRSTVISPEKRIGDRVALAVVSRSEAIDIDTFDDWSLCEYYLSVKRILFVVSGYEEIGLGHIYRTLTLANEIVSHQVLCLVDRKSQLGFDVLAGNNYEVHIQQSGQLIDDIVRLKPDVIINDCLDTSREYVSALKKRGFTVINLEDLGEGAQLADLVINEIYPEKEIFPNHYYGQKYFCARTEFILAPTKKIEPSVRKVLLTFGGVDPNNFTKVVLEAIYEYCGNHNIEIHVLAGFGYNKYETLRGFSEIHIHRGVTNVSAFMLDADLIFTSAGRTTFEIACIGTPAIVLAQNEREVSHFFASKEYGFQNLGLGSGVSQTTILEVFRDLVVSPEKRAYMHDLMLANDLRAGKQRVIRLILDRINQS